MEVGRVLAPLRWFPTDGSAEWLTRLDARLALVMLDSALRRAHSGPPPRVLEIGVWKGAWSAVVLMNRLDAVGIGVDPYPGGADVRDDMLNWLARLEVSDRFRLLNGTNELTAEGPFNLVHIDGEHTEQAVWGDLNAAAAVLADDGIIAVDDFNHRWFPGIASALHRYCEHADFRMFLSSGNKAYLAHRLRAASLYTELLEDLSEDPEVRLSRYWRDGEPSPPRYVEVTDVLGQPVLIATMRTTPPGVAGRAIRAATPPILIDALRRLRRPRLEGHNKSL